MRPLPRRLRHGEEATLVEHLGELRTRIVVALLALTAAFVVTYVFRAYLLDLLTRPLPHRLEKPVTFGVAEPFITSVTVSLYAAFVLALPVILYQFWAFLAPAFDQSSQRLVAGLSAVAAVLGAAGLAFGYFIALPNAVHFLTSYDESHYTILIRARDYYSFAALVLLAVAVVFEVPLIVIGMVRVGFVSARTLRARWRLGIVIMAALAVALPGVDPVTTMFEMVPLMILYALTLAIAPLVERRRTRAAPEAAADSY
jgi:sec-independent protein translocase protein TatC